MAPEQANGNAMENGSDTPRYHTCAPVIQLNDSDRLFSLGERIVAVESVFVTSINKF
jgi:hypothetical protein